ncbi:MAG: hypothetical protein AB7H90_10310 [Alphaproteobacteria bacterium]
MARYEAGETLASIARTYDCSPPAISYVVSKSRARLPARDSSVATPSGPEAQLIKATASEPVETGSSRRSRLDAPAAHGGAAHGGAERRAEAMATGSDIAAAPDAQRLGGERYQRTPPEKDGLLRDGAAIRDPRPSSAHTSMQVPGEGGDGRLAPAETMQRQAAASPQLRGEGDTRHRLHLPLGNGTASHNGSSEFLFPPADRSVADISRPAQAHANRPLPPPPGRPAATGFSEAGPAPEQLLRQGGQQTGSAAAGKQGAGAFIDHELRARVDTDIAVFLAAFDAALTQDTQENRSALREATHRLLRAGARTTIELERLEARMPLKAHDRGGSDPGAWRQR